MVDADPTPPTGDDPDEPAGPAPDPAAPRRRPRSRLTADVLEAGRQSGAREGLEWLGREPESKASLLYRALRLVTRALAFGAFRFRIETSGQAFCSMMRRRSDAGQRSSGSPARVRYLAGRSGC